MIHSTGTRRLWLLGILVAVLAGCNRPLRSPGPPKPTTTQAAMAECLPCRGHKIEVTATTPRVEYAGKTYYFCSDGCRDAFVANPAKYIPAPSTTLPGKDPARTDL